MRTDPITLQKILNGRLVQRRSNKEVAAELGLAEYQVSRIFNSAFLPGGPAAFFLKEAGGPDEEVLKKAFHLRWLKIVETKGLYEEQTIELGKAAASKFEELSKTPCTIALGGGETLHQMAVALSDNTSRSITLTSTALMCRSIYGATFDGAFVSMEVAAKSDLKQCRARICPLPPLPKKNPEAARKFTQQLFNENSEVREVFEKAVRADVIFLGVSDPSEQTTAECHDRVEISAVARNLKPSGTINFSFFNERGDDITTEAFAGSYPEIKSGPDRHPFLAALSISAIKKAAEDETRLVLIVAGGAKKKDAILACLRGRMANAAILDRDTALYLESTINAKTTKSSLVNGVRGAMEP